ncbi:hypothetical protein K3495_g3588 [Podosphaera aphanis]|nr:hypothetical protein K3495_g3588 [Podosphaera aphanis]
MLHHFVPHRQLYADLDASAKGICAIVYHATVDPPTPKSVQPKFFLSRLLKPAERHYWLTELEVAALCWVVAKTRHLIEASKLPTIFYTDHSASIEIATQTSMNTTSFVRMNPRHHQSSEFLSRFRIIVKHKPGKLNVVPDALSRLHTITEISHTTHCPNSLQVPQKLEILFIQTQLAYPKSTVHLGNNFITDIKSSYLEDEKCKKLLEILNANDEHGVNSASLPLELKNGILYALPDVNHQNKRIVIPKSIIQSLFELAHDQLGHLGFSRIHERITKKFFIFNSTKLLKSYLWHCCDGLSPI